MRKSELAELIRAGALRNIAAMSDDELLSSHINLIKASISANLDPSFPRGREKTSIFATIPPIPSAHELRQDALAGIAETDETTLIHGFVSCLDCGEIPPAKILDALIAQAENELHLQTLLIAHPELSIHQYAPNLVKPSHRHEVRLYADKNKKWA